MRRVPLLAVRVLPEHTSLSEQTGQAMALGEDVTLWHPVFPDVQTDTSVVLGDPATVLLEAARSALIVVVGARGTDRMSGVRLGSVTQRLLLGCGCPVLVAHN